MIKLENISYRPGGKFLLDSISIDFSGANTWAITGGNGSGKTLLAMIMAGILKPSSGNAVIDGKIGYTSFELQQKIMAEERRKDNSRFLQGGIDPGTAAGDFILPPADAVDYEKGKQLFERYMEIFSLTAISKRGLRFLSTGEFRKVLLCRALCQSPDILIVDDPFDGLDVASRSNMLMTLDTLVREGERIFIVTPRESEIPSWIQGKAVMENGRILEAGKHQPAEQGKKGDAFGGNISSFRPGHEENPVRTDSTAVQISALEQRIRAGSEMDKLSAGSCTCVDADADTVISMKNVSVSYEGARIISDINWTVRKGDRWKITGPNGCGKSTLLSLINGDNQKAYANDITLFGSRRGSGESVWDIKKRIGYVSGDLQMSYRGRTTLADTVLSGFFDSVGLYGRPTGLQRDEALTWIEAAGLIAKKDFSFSALSWGEKRAALIMRALIKRAELVILDEPCQGLDEKNTDAVLEIIKMLSGYRDNSMLLVTHDMHPCPDTFKKHLAFSLHRDGGYTAVVL